MVRHEALHVLAEPAIPPFQPDGLQDVASIPGKLARHHEAHVNGVSHLLRELAAIVSEHLWSTSDISKSFTRIEEAAATAVPAGFMFTPYHATTSQEPPVVPTQAYQHVGTPKDQQMTLSFTLQPVHR